MAKKRAKQKKKGRGNNNKNSTGGKASLCSSWVDDIVWEPCSPHNNNKGGEESTVSASEPESNQSNNDDDDDGVSIVSWNVLAQSYLTKRSHSHIPPKHQSVVFSRKQRLALLQKTLRRLSSVREKNNSGGVVVRNTDILCLQEVDQTVVLEQLRELGYQGVSTPTTKGGGGGRVDACCIYYLESKWTLVRSLVVQLDDLAFHTRASSCDATTTRTTRCLKDDPLRGLQQGFLRRNAAILVEIRNSKGQSVVVANAHLYWNPDQEHVKLCQVHYVLQQLSLFNSSQQQQPCPFLFCGDFNSLPKSTVHQYLTRRKINAKRVAPWFHWNDDDEDREKHNVIVGNDLSDQLSSQCRVSPPLANPNAEAQDNSLPSSPSVRYMLDFTLNKLTRWLRILGIDAALETTEEEQERTKHANIIIFNRCRKESRTLLTTSSKLMLRKDCPPGAYLVNPRRLEESLVHLLFSHGVVLEPRTFLTRCVVCNGKIVKVTKVADKRRIFSEHDAPDLSQELSVYCCDGCGQGYWWCDLPSSSAARVKTQATKLFELCLRGGIPVKGDLNMFDFVDVEQERQAGVQERKKLERECLDVIDWLKDEHLSHELPLKSAYATDLDRKDGLQQELLPFTNVTHDFVGTLDYIFLDESHLWQTHRLHVPCTFEELRGPTELANGHLLPSNIWPSDHLAIGARVSFGPSEDCTRPTDTASSSSGENSGSKFLLAEANDSGLSNYPRPRAAERKNSPLSYCGSVDTDKVPPPPTMASVSHGTRCGCGCVPNVLSLFEMAEMRKQARLKASKTKM